MYSLHQSLLTVSSRAPLVCACFSPHARPRPLVCASSQVKFDRARAFNQSIGDWDTSAVTNMWGMFQQTVAFNQPIGAWDTSAVEDMSHMFDGASEFNQPIGTWNTSAVKDIRDMFSGSHFDQLIGSWDVQHARGADEVKNFWRLSKAAKCSISQSWLLARPVVSRLACPSCQEIKVPCPGGSEFACVAGTCRPINGNFIELGRAVWAPGPSTAVGSGCREACAAWENCTGFLLKDGGCSTLHGGLPIKRGEGRALAFVKRDCSLFSCPVGSVPVKQSGKDDFNAATCCACLPHLVAERRGAALRCRCPPHQYGHAPDCYSCGPGSSAIGNPAWNVNLEGSLPATLVNALLAPSQFMKTIASGGPL